MQLVRRYRLSALFCAFAVLVCELIARPYANMGIDDDGPYILVAKNLAATGHIVYNGWSEAMLGWQLYLGAAFIKLFGFSFTTVRMSNLFIAMALAFLLQRIMVRSAINERNAMIATLALVLSPLYLLLSASFMTDITGLFGIALCVYACLRALQAASSGAAIGWLWFAVVSNAICGTSRQLAWLGILVIVPSTLWLLRTQRRTVIAGGAAIVPGLLFIFGALHWFQLQPYTEHGSVHDGHVSVLHFLLQILQASVDFPFLMLPLAALFLPEVRRISLFLLALFAVSYGILAYWVYHARHVSLLDPTLGDWIGVHGVFEAVDLKGTLPLLLPIGAQVVLTILSIGGALGFLGFLLYTRDSSADRYSDSVLSWKQFAILFGPFTLTYILLVMSRGAATYILDRYLLALLVVAALCLVRLYQERIRFELPLSSLALISMMATLGVTIVHNSFALSRARVRLADELRASGVPDSAVDNGWEYNLTVELGYAKYIAFPTIQIPVNAYVAPPPPPADMCTMKSYPYTLHVHPLYGVSFDPSACYGPASFPPVQYARWLSTRPGTLYVVRYWPSSPAMR